MTGNNWMVSVPLDDLLALRDQAQALEIMRQENDQLRGEVESLRQTLFQFMEVFNEFKRESMGR